MGTGLGTGPDLAAAGRAAAARPAPAVPQRGSPPVRRPGRHLSTAALRLARNPGCAPARCGATPSSSAAPGSSLSSPPRGARPSDPADPRPGRPGPAPPLFLTVEMPPLDSPRPRLLRRQ